MNWTGTNSIHDVCVVFVCVSVTTVTLLQCYYSYTATTCSTLGWRRPGATLTMPMWAECVQCMYQHEVNVQNLHSCAIRIYLWGLLISSNNGVLMLYYLVLPPSTFVRLPPSSVGRPWWWPGAVDTQQNGPSTGGRKPLPPIMVDQPCTATGNHHHPSQFANLYTFGCNNISRPAKRRPEAAAAQQDNTTNTQHKS